MIMRIVAVDVLRELLMLGVRGRVKRRRLVVQRRIAAATVEDILDGLLVETVQQLVQIGVR